MLEIRHLTKRYGALTAIRDVSFEVRTGEVLGLLGPNGSGKSTTVKILTGLLQPTSGDVLLDGCDAFAAGEAYKSIVVRFGARDVSGIPLLQRPDFLLGIPLMLTFWVFVGLRASFFVPSELPAAWTFRANAPENTNAYVLGARAAMIALVAPPAVLLALGLAAPLVDWTGAIQHALFVLLLVAAFADFTVLTVESIPFTRPYIPGHAKLKARWPLYVFGPLGFAWGLAALELLAWTATNGGTILLSFAVFVVVIFELAVRRAGHYWPAPTDDTPTDDESAITVLDLAGFAQT